MATGKKSFVLYADIVHSIDLLTNEQAGKLFKHILKYVNDFDPKEEDTIVRIAFEPIKQQLKRDLKQWKSERRKRSEAGKIGGKKSAEKRAIKSKQKQAIVESASTNEANQAVNVNETVNDNVSVSVIERGAQHENAIMIYDAETEILGNQIQFEKICMTAGAEISNAKEALRKYHLHLEDKEQYPKGRKATYSGFEKWLMNEKNFNSNGNNNSKGVGKSKVNSTGHSGL